MRSPTLAEKPFRCNIFFSTTLRINLFGFFSVEVCLQRLWVSMVPNPYLADTLGISTQLWNGSGGLLFCFPASSADFIPLTFEHTDWLLKTFCRDASKGKKTHCTVMKDYC